MHKQGSIFMVILCHAIYLRAAPAHFTDGLPKATLNEVPVISVAEEQTTPREAARIKRLIRNLARIDHPDWGLSATLSGAAFAPIVDSEKLESVIKVSANLKTSSNLVELAMLGPTALPFLLEALDDKTPTQLVIRLPNPYSGGMWFANELQGNPAVVVERKVIESRPRMDAVVDFPATEGFRSYNLTVGDVCFVIIGEIVNRPYSAARYQMTACTVINSPTHDSTLAKEVREVWAAANTSQRLLDSLLTDFATERITFAGNLRAEPSRWLVPIDLQPGAAMRLLYYYPRETTNLIARRLQVINPAKLGSPSMGGAEANLVKAVAWCTEPAIEVELRRIFQATINPEILAATAGAMRRVDAAACRHRLEAFLNRLPPDEKGPFGSGHELLMTLGKGFGAEAKPDFKRYMSETLPSRECLCDVLAAVHGEWSVDLLGSLLTDTDKDERYERSIISGKSEPSLPVRICDEAAGIISQNFPRLKFEMAGTQESLDRQIRTMRDQIANHDF